MEVVGTLRETITILLGLRVQLRKGLLVKLRSIQQIQTVFGLSRWRADATIVTVKINAITAREISVRIG